MGGRGATSATNSGPLSNVSPSSPMSDKEFGALKSQAASYGITLDDSLRTLPGQSVLEAYEGVKIVKSEFKQAPDDLFTISAEPRKGNAYAVANPIRGVIVNSNYFNDYQALVASTEHGKSVGWSPASGVRSITSHEAGHLLEAALVRKELGLGPGEWNYKATVMWNKAQQSGDVVRKAVSQTNKASGTKKRKIEVLDDLSLYASSHSKASHQNAEGLAEAVADYVTNRGTSKPFSGFVWDILKQKLG